MDRYTTLIALQKKIIADSAAHRAIIETVSLPVVRNLRRMSDNESIIEEHEEFVAYTARVSSWEQQHAHLADALTEQMGQLVHLVLEDFNGSDLSDPDIRKKITEIVNGRIFEDDKLFFIDSLDENAIRGAEDALVAVAAFRQVISKSSLKVFSNIKNWQLFLDRYGPAIMGAY